MEIVVVLILLLVAVGLLLVEMFLIPGISIAGIGGLLFLGGAVYYAYAFISPEAGHLTLIAAFIMMTVAIVIFIRSKALEKMSLKTEIEGKNDPMEGVVVQAGDQGITISRLAPMGKIRVNGHIVEAKAMDDFIDQEEKVIIIKVQSTNVLVERSPENK
ncbi:MAG: NfeD family protein [Paludibacter sp.]|nr:NfeD family protein [Paludibacter sp.]